MTQPHISFYEAASQMERICATVDSAEQITEELENAFKSTMSDLSDSVDRRISYIKYAESQIAGAAEMRDQWSNRIKRFEKVLERIKKNTIEVIKAAPDLIYRGDYGILKVQKNSVPSVIVDEEELHTDFCNVEYVPNKKKIKEAILGGEVVEGAHLEYGEHLAVKVG